MSFLRVTKQSKLAIILGLLMVCIFYLATMSRADFHNGSLTMTEPILHPLYVGETGMKNPVQASAFFTSTYTFPGGDGCPCGGIFKPAALLAMLVTWQFYANRLIFSLMFYSVLRVKIQAQ